MTDEYLYDRLSRMTQAKQYDAGSLVTDKRADFTYNGAGQLDTIQRYNHLTSSSSTYLITTSDYDYDGAARLTALNHTRNSTTLAGYNYTWDAANRITNMDFSPSTYVAEDAAFNYDSTSQLIGAERSGTANDETYLYDDNGNRDTVSRDGATNQDWQIGTNNRLTDDGTFTYTYDNEGNRLTKVRKSSAAADDKTVTYTWDYRNRLSTVTFKRNDTTVTKTVDYSYDMFNRWTKRILDSDGALGSATLIVDDFMHDAEEKIVHTSSQMVGRSHVYLHGPLQDQVLFDEVAAGLRITLADHLNTVRDVYDTSGNLLNHVTYDSFGRRIAETNTTIEVFYGFTGRPYDEDTGLGNHLHRWIDVWAGKWISEDPIGFEGEQVNLAVYVGNAPTVHVDPSGLIIAGIDGSESDDLAKTKAFQQNVAEGYVRSHVQNFIKDVKDVSKDAWHGPETLGLNSNKIKRAVLKWIIKEFTNSIVCIGITPPIDLIGFSRGGHIANQVAWELSQKGIKIRFDDGEIQEFRPVVRFLGLYDPVDSDASIPHAKEAIAPNVQNSAVIFAAHKKEDASEDQKRSRPFFNRIGATDTMTHTSIKVNVFGTHSGLGGNPWGGDMPEGHEQTNDIRAAVKADTIIRTAAAGAGVDIAIKKDSDYGFTSR